MAHAAEFLYSASWMQSGKGDGRPDGACLFPEKQTKTGLYVLIRVLAAVAVGAVVIIRKKAGMS